MPDPTIPAHEPLADELLVVRCLLGEAAAFDELVAHWHEPLWRYLRRLLDEDEAAADAVQDCWLRVLRSLPRLRDPARLRPWLFGIARRTAMDRLRAEYRAPVEADIDPETLMADPQDDLREDQLAAMHAQLQRLPLVEREVLELFYLRGLSLAQLVDVLAVPLGTVKSRLFRARGMLRAHLLAEDLSS
ncbi:MAG: sigma-70 family RNA polymerase sigma factor [Gemmatimonadaceae bacterium]|nr:sigma-70 family RNA polymerase sigma factor [Gemmatimonadaceae bacterium]